MVWLDLLHPAPILAVLATAAIVTTLAAHGRPPLGRLVLFLLAILLTQVAISLHNDYCDRELDALAKPWRALPSGLLSARAALAAALALAAAGLLVAAVLGPAVFLLGALGTGAGFAYNGWLKRRRLTWLPFYVAIPALPICAFVVAGTLPPRLWLVYVIGAPLVVGIHLADTLDDIESDRAHDVRGFAQALGPRGARAACWLSVLAALGLAALLWPPGRPPGAVYAAAFAFLALAVAADRFQRRRLHWLGVMLSAIALAASWLGALAA